MFGLDAALWAEAQAAKEDAPLPLTEMALPGEVRAVVPPLPPPDMDDGSGEWLQDANRLIPFVFPAGIWLNDPAYDRADASRPLLHSFSITLPDAMPLYGHVLTRHHRVTDPAKQALLRMQTAAALLTNPNPQQAVQEADPALSSTKLFLPCDTACEPTSLCILTTEPSYESMRGLLASFHAWLPLDAPFRRRHARMLYAAMLGEDTVRQHLAHARSVLNRRPAPALSGADGAPLGISSSQEEDSEDDDSRASACDEGSDEDRVAPLTTGRTRAGPTFTFELKKQDDAEDDALAGAQDVLIMHGATAPAASNGTSFALSNDGVDSARADAVAAWLASGTSGRATAGTAASNEMQWVNIPWLRSAPIVPELRSSPLGVAALVLSPPTFYEWELPQSDWTCIVCKERMMGISRDFLLSALAASLARRRASEVGSPLSPGSGQLLHAPLQEFLRCVETRGCLRCTAGHSEGASSSTTGPPGGALSSAPSESVGLLATTSGLSSSSGGGPPTPATPRRLGRRLSSRRVSRMMSSDTGGFEAAPTVYDLLDDPMWPYVAPSLHLHDGVLRVLGIPASDELFPMRPSWMPSLSLASSSPSVFSASSVAVPWPFTMPSSSALPSLDVDPRQLFARVQPANIIAILTALMCERHVIVVSKDVSILPDIMTTMLSLLHPFRWVGSFIPVFPASYSLLDMLGAPLPKFWGVHSAVAQACADDAWWDHTAPVQRGELRGVKRPNPASDNSGASTRSNLGSLNNDGAVPDASDYWARYEHIIQGPKVQRAPPASRAEAASVMGVFASLASHFSTGLSSGVTDFVVAPTHMLLQSTWDWSAATAMDGQGLAASDTIGRRARNRAGAIQEKSSVATIIWDLDVDAISPNYLPPTHLLPPRLSLRLWQAILQHANLYTWVHPDRPIPPRLPDMPEDVSPSERTMAESLYREFEKRAVDRAWDGLHVGQLPDDAADGEQPGRTDVLYADSLFLPLHADANAFVAAPELQEVHAALTPPTASSMPPSMTASTLPRHVTRRSCPTPSLGSAGDPIRALSNTTIRTLDAVHSDDDADEDDEEDDVQPTQKGGRAHLSLLDVQPICVTPPWALWRANNVLQELSAAHENTRFIKAVLPSAASSRPVGRRSSATTTSFTHVVEGQRTLMFVPEPHLHFTRLRVDFMRVMVSLFKAFRVYMRSATAALTDAPAAPTALVPGVMAVARITENEAALPADAVLTQRTESDAHVVDPSLSLSQLAETAPPTASIPDERLQPLAQSVVREELDAFVGPPAGGVEPVADASAPALDDGFVGVAHSHDGASRTSSDFVGDDVGSARASRTSIDLLGIDDVRSHSLSSAHDRDSDRFSAVDITDYTVQPAEGPAVAAASVNAPELPPPPFQTQHPPSTASGAHIPTPLPPHAGAADANDTASTASPDHAAPSPSPKPAKPTVARRAPPPPPPLASLTVVTSPMGLPAGISALPPLAEGEEVRLSSRDTSQATSRSTTRRSSMSTALPGSRSFAVMPDRESGLLGGTSAASTPAGRPARGSFSRASDAGKSFARLFMRARVGSDARVEDTTAAATPAASEFTLPSIEVPAAREMSADAGDAAHDMDDMTPMPFVGSLGPRSKGVRMSMRTPGSVAAVLRSSGTFAMQTPTGTPSHQPRPSSLQLPMSARGIVRSESLPSESPAGDRGGSFSARASVASAVRKQVLLSEAVSNAFARNAVDNSPMAAMASMTRAAQMKRVTLKVINLNRLRGRGASIASEVGSQSHSEDGSAARGSVRLDAAMIAAAATGSPPSHTGSTGSVSSAFIAQEGASGPVDTIAPPALVLEDLSTSRAADVHTVAAVAAVADDSHDVDGDDMHIPSFDEAFSVPDFLASESALDAEPLITHIVQQTQMFRMFIQERVMSDTVDMFDRACYRRMFYRAWRHNHMSSKSITGKLFKAIRGTLCKNWELRLFELHGNVVAYYAAPDAMLDAAARVRALRTRLSGMAPSGGDADVARKTAAAQLSDAEATYDRLRTRNFRRSFHLIAGRTEVVIPSTTTASFRTPYVFQLVNPAVDPRSLLASRVSESDAATGMSSSASQVPIRRTVSSNDVQDAATHEFAGIHRDVLTMCAHTAAERRQWILHLKARLRNPDATQLLSSLYLEPGHAATSSTADHQRAGAMSL